MRIAIFNWRDIKNPRKGGAEIVTHEVAKRWVQWGHDVTLFTAGFPGGKESEVIDGVKIVRRGRQYTVHLQAFFYYQKTLKGNIDLIIDEVNTIPFFTNFYVKEKKVVYFNQLAREVWFYEAKFPISIVGYLLEPFYVRTYKNTPAMVISQSTKSDIQKLGISQVDIFPMAIEFEQEQPYLETKEKDLTLIFVGRLVKSKRPEEAIQALYRLAVQVPEAKLWLVGGGEPRYVNYLKEKVRSLGLEKNVVFHGFLSQEDKYRLMSRAHFILVTSIREGWGLIVTEANALNTVGVVYDVPGLRDSVQHNKTGLVVKPNPVSLAEGVKSLWEDREKYLQFQSDGRKWSRDLTWESTAKVSLDIVKKVVEARDG